ncbi:MAG TPA: hypothetical protein PLY34_16710 [Ferruginibacter sp.]|nr:hypothetical protein [Ferruginibacter sp.]
MGLFLGILALGIIIPVILMIIGIVNLFNPDIDVKKKGRNFLLSGILLILIEILIGYSVCSGLRFN